MHYAQVQKLKADNANECGKIEGMHYARVQKLKEKDRIFTGQYYMDALRTSAEIERTGFHRLVGSVGDAFCTSVLIESSTA